MTGARCESGNSTSVTHTFEANELNMILVVPVKPLFDSAECRGRCSIACPAETFLKL